MVLARNAHAFGHGNVVHSMEITINGRKVKEGKGNESLPTPSFSCLLGFRVEELGSSGSAGAYPSMKLLPMFRIEA
jgi:hypothetical protein